MTNGRSPPESAATTNDPEHPTGRLQKPSTGGSSRSGRNRYTETHSRQIPNESERHEPGPSPCHCRVQTKSGTTEQEATGHLGTGHLGTDHLDTGHQGTGHLGTGHQRADDQRADHLQPDPLTTGRQHIEPVGLTIWSHATRQRSMGGLTIRSLPVSP